MTKTYRCAARIVIDGQGHLPCENMVQQDNTLCLDHRGKVDAAGNYHISTADDDTLSHRFVEDVEFYDDDNEPLNDDDDI